MFIDVVDSPGETLDAQFQVSEETSCVVWNGRVVSLEKRSDNKKTPEVLSMLVSDYFLPREPTIYKAFEDYFDSDLKKQNEFDIAVYQYHVRCNSEEAKKALEAAFVKMSTGMLGIVIGVANLIVNPIGGSFAIYLCGERVWLGIKDFKKAMEARGVDLDDVQFVTWTEDLKRNTDEIMNSTMLEPWKPLETPNYHYTDNPHYHKPLDPTFNPYGYA